MDTYKKGANARPHVDVKGIANADFCIPGRMWT
jgi:hypothetical protein